MYCRLTISQTIFCLILYFVFTTEVLFSIEVGVVKKTQYKKLVTPGYVGSMFSAFA